MKRQELADFRKEKKLTQKEMAEKVGIGYQLYQYLELGLRNPSLKTLQKFKMAFPNTRIDKFFLQ